MPEFLRRRAEAGGNRQRRPFVRKPENAARTSIPDADSRRRFRTPIPDADSGRRFRTPVPAHPETRITLRTERRMFI